MPDWTQYLRPPNLAADLRVAMAHAERMAALATFTPWSEADQADDNIAADLSDRAALCERCGSVRAAHNPRAVPILPASANHKPMTLYDAIITRRLETP